MCGEGSSALGEVLRTVGQAVVVAAKVAVPIVQTSLAVSNAKQQAKNERARYEYEANMAKENAKIANQNAAMERQQGIEEARLQRMKVASAIGSQKTAMASNGVDVGQGTALDVIEDTASMGELDALQTRYNYEKKALAYESQSNNFLNQSNLDIIAGQNADKAGRMNALAYGLDGLTKTTDVASKWYEGGLFGSDKDSLKINKKMKNQWAIAGLSA